MFFQSINTMMAVGTDLSINIRKVGEQLVVATLPRNNNLKDEAQNYLMPLTVTGTPMELDTGFLQAILQPIQKASGLLINLEQFEKQAAITAAKTKSEKAKTDKEGKEGKEKRENYDKCLKQADELTATKRYSEALTYLKQAKAFATPMQQADLAKKIKLVEQEQAQGSLFGAVETTEPQAAPQQPSVQQQTTQMPQSIQQPVSMPQTEQPIMYRQQQQRDYYRPAAQQPMQQPQSMQQPVIHPAQFTVTTNGQPMPNPAQQREVEQTFFRQEHTQYNHQPVQRPNPAQPIMQPEYNMASWSEKEETEANGFREDPYAGYPDFPEECRMRDEAQVAAVY